MIINPFIFGATSPISLVGNNPVAIPDLTWEETAVFEPCVIYEGGTFKMWYTGGWTNPGIGYATSADGSVWAKNSTPVIGQGGSSIAGIACRIEVMKNGATYHAYYSDGVGGGANLKHATSTDGLAWSSVATVVANNALAGVDGWANSSVWIESGTWYMLLEGHRTSAPFWKIFLLTSSDGLTWTFLNSSAALSSLQVSGGGMWGGPNMALKLGGTYHLYYHASATAGSALPTDLYHATSTDLINWTISGSPTAILTHLGTGMEGDQIADPCVIEVLGKVYCFYDGDDNPANCANIGLASYLGSIAGGGTFTRLATVDYTNPVEVWGMHEASGNRAGTLNSLTLTDNGGVTSTTGTGATIAAVMTGSQGLSRATEAKIQLGNFNFSFAGWVNVSSNTLFPVLLTKYDSTQKQIYLYLEPTDFRLVVYPDLLGSSFGDLHASNFGVVPVNTWCFVAIWHDADNNIIGISVNAGTPNTVSYNKGLWPTGTSPLRFGFDGGSIAATRRMERWAYWRRVISSGEISALYNAGAGKDWPY